MPESNPHQFARQWKRRVILALLLLCAGAVVNVAVAYFCFAAAKVHPAFGSEAPIGEVDWVHNVLPTIPDAAIIKQQNGVGFKVTDYLGPKEEESASGYFRMMLVSRVEIGLPLRCIQGVLISHDPQKAIVRRGMIFAGSKQDYFHQEVPIAVKPPGFIINTIFYALLLWLLFFAPGSARRMLRRRRGLCEKCAYPIGVSAVCTECGAAVRRMVT